MRQQYRRVIDPSDEECPATAAQATIHQPRHKPGVLVVDDDALIRSMLRSGLEQHGFKVWLAASGGEALAMYRQHWTAITVVLLDVRMPGKDGLQTLAALRRVAPDVLACFMSGDMGGYQPEELRERGARFVFAKPFSLEDLAQTLWLLVHESPSHRVPPCKA
jgi:CheY-like chemotaxis protein